MKRVIRLLKDNGPMLSGDLARLYEKEYHTSNEAARKAISRANSPVKRIANLKFEKNQMFYYLESQFMGDKYKVGLIEAVRKSSKSNWIVLEAFLAQGGFLSKDIFPAFTSMPVEKVKGHKTAQVAVDSLLRAKLILEHNDTTYALNPLFFLRNKYGRSIGLEIAKKIIINDFNQWARTINMVSFEKGKLLYDTPVFAHFQWCYSAPSYIQPLYMEEKQIPGFIIADVFFGETATLENLSFFLEKLAVIRSFKKLPRFLPVLLVDQIDPDALRELKNQKVVVAILQNFFSDKYTMLLEQLVNAFTNAVEIVTEDPDQIYALFDALAKSEGKYNNMAGDLFELLVGCYYSRLGCNFLESKKRIWDENGKHKELDWLIMRDGKIIVVECKAEKSGVRAAFAQKWLSDNIPFTRKWILENYRNSNMEFQLWSVGGFDEGAAQLLRQAESSTKKYAVRYFSKEQMLQMAKDSHDTSFLKIMQEHFQWRDTTPSHITGS